MAKKQAGRANNPREMNTNDLRNSQDQKSKPEASSSASAGQDDGSVHSPLVAYASMLSLLTFCPPFVIFLWYTMVHMDGSVALFWNFCKQEGFYGFLKIWPQPTLLAWKLIGGYAAFEAFLLLILPGEKVLGPVSPTGNVPEYKANGLAAYFVSLATYIALWWFGVFNPVVVYDHLGEIFSALIIGSFVFCIFLYLKGHIAPSSSDSGSSGNAIIDFYWGMELYPRIGKHFDIKVFTNCRFGMMSWAILVVTYCIKQYEEYGRIADSMLASAVLMLVYITKFFLWESGYFNTMDIAHDRGTKPEVATSRSDIFKKPTIFGLLLACDTFIAFATSGFYICWGCLVWVPSVYTSPALYLVNHPVNLGLQLSIAIIILGIICIFVNYDCDRQRQLFRKTNGNCSIWGKAPSKIEASYVTTTGEKKSSLLLTSGWWGLARHFHYVPEILAAFFWSVPGLFNHFFPYFYVIFLTILLFDRAQRDDKRCKAKYGKYWDMYCKKVPYKIIPGIY